ncbi:hypothetical protein AK812_SmicGene29843 [Symbiodinium microadriaticum]|uniref:Uncharacterized protein n=1 Tax=Symbiodinium microadriaticum TaxID=2951 RepID=A0A1Q9D0R9_SYMMI|nr:hypothetical protein AK812_SmicGene29843 [Symbiodinium microadriaticum]CAE7907979.1 unnamed protein product [Symbiodinium microadriaticum]
MPRATVSFKHEEQEWNHEFEVDAATTVLDLKRKMTSSAPEHAAWFELCRDGSTVKNSDLVDPLAIYIFHYLGPSGSDQDNLEQQVAGLTGEDHDDPFPSAREEPRPLSAPVAAAIAEPAVPRWRITGGSDKGGIIVRQSESLKSADLGRVSTGAIVEEIAKVGDRLCYRLEEGTGPAKGWVSIRVSGKELAEKIS